MSSTNSGGQNSLSFVSDDCGASAAPAKMSLTSSTLKRNPKMELSRSDLLRLLSILEGELQAREIVIAVLKAEQIKKLLYPNKLAAVESFESFRSKTIKLNDKLNAKPSDSNLVEYCDPWNALSRDAFGAYDPSFDKTTTIALFNMKMNQLEALIVQQRNARFVLMDQLKVIESKYNQIVAELELERRVNSEVSGADTQSNNTVRLETEAKAIAQSLENERNREKQIVLCLLSERKQLIIKLIEERQKNEELLHLLSTEKGKIAEMVEGLEDESKRSLQMEAELEKYLNDFEGERQRFRKQLSASETRNAELAAEVDRLRQQLTAKQTNSVSLGEGVRSTIVTMSSASRCVQTVPSVSTVSQPRASVAQHVSPMLSNNSEPLKAKSPVSAQHSYATVQPISSTKLNATIPPPPSVPAPPPKALVNNSNSVKTSEKTVSRGPNKANAFQNITYSLESIGPEVSNASSRSKAAVTESQANSPAPSKAVTQTSSSPSGQTNPTAAGVQRKLSASGVGRGTPPPIPPNKPIIKPVLPPQALQQRSKDLNSAKGGAKAGQPAVNSTTNANIPSNSIKNTAINSSDSAGETSGETTLDTDRNSVDVLCQELENFNSLLVSMVSTASQNNS